MCDSPAVSVEHVPPKCIFPEKKDVEGQDFRKQLITVPSCDLHNSAKSSDDEFLMVSLAGIIGNNSIGYWHKLGKIDRAIRRSSNRLLDTVFTKRKHYSLYRDNKFLEIIWGTPDHERLIKCFTHIAYGLYFYHYQSRFCGETKVMLGYLHSTDENNNNFVQFIKHRAEIELRDIQKFGGNQDVFYYQLTKEDNFGLFMLHLRFYGGIDIYISFIPNDKEKPYHLAIDLMNHGIETTITLEGKQYHINKS